MNKSKIKQFFKWWFSIHPMNLIIFEAWISLAKGKKEERENY